MSEEGALYHLDKLKRRYILLRLLEITFLSIGTGVLTYALASLLVPYSITKVSFSIAAGLSIFISREIHYRLHKLENDFFTRYLNEKYPILKESADLLTRHSNDLTILQQLQKLQTLKNFHQLYPEIKLPQNVLPSLGIFLACIAAYFILSAFNLHVTSSTTKSELLKLKEIKAANGDTTSVFIKSLSINVTPPSYTQVPASISTGFTLTFPEGSSIYWKAEFSGIVTNPKILFSGRDSINLTLSDENTYSVKKLIIESGFYQLQWTDHHKIHRSDYYSIETIKDQIPKVAITNLNQFTEIGFGDSQSIHVKSSLGDDYGITKAHIIATVSKGSGESVKFREEKLEFTSPKYIQGKQVDASLTINLKKLGLEPGDELYFYVEAFDNKTPEHNHNRTETFFIALKDTTTEISVADAGLGVDLLPEYFRSQRQIIIDTEKLLKDKKKLAKKEFNSTSNELGYDQKVLRLRYGQFLGEEADSGVGQEAVEPPGEHDGKEVDVLKQFGHQHDTENEHNLVDEKTVGHDDGNSSKAGDDKEDPLKAFTHSHDSEDQATFFEQSVRDKLKAALAVMWDAELYLRLYEPAKSLPFQYTALKLLKEISNDSRIYVHRTGFDPPPLKDEKRLTAELIDIKTFTNKTAYDSKEIYPAIREGLMTIEEMLNEDDRKVSESAKRVFLRTGQELSTLAIERPAIYLKGLSLLKSLTDQKVAAEDMPKTLSEVRKILYTTLPEQSLSPVRRQSTAHSLDKKFIQHFDESNK